MPKCDFNKVAKQLWRAASDEGILDALHYVSFAIS